MSVVYGNSTQMVPVAQDGTSVLEAARRRIVQLFDRFAVRIVNFSGGKDSTVVLHLALEEATRRGEPLDVFFSDEEAVDPDTLAYLEHVRSWPEVRFRWCCAPVRHTFASHGRAMWTCWDPEARDVWIRDQPPYARTADATWKPGLSMHDLAASLSPDAAPGSVCHLVGVRVAESFNRWRALIRAGDYVTVQPGYAYAKPIYDWKTTDVWAVIKREGWRYSAYYDRLHRLGIARHSQRIAPIGNVASTSRMALWPQLYPVFWEQVLRRLPELDSAARYGATKLYRKGRAKPLGMTWQEWTFHLLDDIHEPTIQTLFRREISNALVRWQRHASVPFPEEPLRVAGRRDATTSWKQLAAQIAKHDMIGSNFRDRR